MQIQLMSDLHLECHRDKGRAFLYGLQPAAEVLVLAGDIVSASRTRDHLSMLFAAVSKKFKHVVYVPGNHEFYQGTIHDGWVNIKKAADEVSLKNVRALNNEAVELDGVRFFGGTGWFPRFDHDPAAVAARSMMTDFHVIWDLEPYIYGSNTGFDWGLAGADAEVVVSHHLPCEEAVARQYKNNVMNAFFVSKFDVAGCGAKLWLHGHTHEQVDMQVCNTRVVANPFGYPNELRQKQVFQDAMVLTV